MSGELPRAISAPSYLAFSRLAMLIFCLVLRADVGIQAVVNTHQSLADSLASTDHRFQDCDRYGSYDSLHSSLEIPSLG